MRPRDRQTPDGDDDAAALAAADFYRNNPKNENGLNDGRAGARGGPSAAEPPAAAPA